MKISVLTKFLLRIVKDNHFTHHLNNDIKFKLSLYDVNLSYLIMKSKLGKTKYKVFLDKVSTLFNVNEYIKNTFSHKNNIVITNIVNYKKLAQYLEYNGVMWGSGKRCTIYQPIDNFKSENYIKLYVDECRVSYGHFYSKMIGDIVLTENEFYEYYENYKEKLNKFFYNCLLTNYGTYKKI